MSRPEPVRRLRVTEPEQALGDAGDPDRDLDLGTSGIGSPLSIALGTPGPASSRVSSSPTSRPVQRWYAAEMATSSVAVASGTRPACPRSAAPSARLSAATPREVAVRPGWPATSEAADCEPLHRPDVQPREHRLPVEARAAWAAPSRSSVGCAPGRAPTTVTLRRARRTPTAPRRRRSPAARPVPARHATVGGRGGPPPSTTPSCGPHLDRLVARRRASARRAA